MIKYEKRQTECLYPIEISCDVCGKSYSLNENELTSLEIDEFIRIDRIGGYSSIFGDMSRIQIDICQVCFKEKLGDHIRLGDNDAETNS